MSTTTGPDKKQETTTTSGVTTTVPAVDGAAPTTVASSVVTTPSGVDTSKVVMVGDSVMLGASGALKAALPGARVDAKVGRQFKQILSVVDWYQRNGYLNGPVVIHLGTNGVFSDEDLDNLVAAAGKRKVLLVNAKVSRPWQSLVNERLAAAVKRHPTVVLVDWYGLSSQHPEWFVNDGAHLRPEGATAFAELIRSNL